MSGISCYVVRFDNQNGGWIKITFATQGLLSLLVLSNGIGDIDIVKIDKDSFNHHGIYRIKDWDATSDKGLYCDSTNNSYYFYVASDGFYSSAIINVLYNKGSAFSLSQQKSLDKTNLTKVG